MYSKFNKYIYISNDDRKLRRPRQIENTGVFFETNLSANNIISFIRALMLCLGLELEDFGFSLAEVPFDIRNEDTWAEGIIPVAKLFYYLMSDLIETSSISAEEIQKLKLKNYTKTLFVATDYPALANSRNDNMGNSTKKRYRAKPLSFENNDIYVSTQFFDSDREAVINWYKAHKK